MAVHETSIIDFVSIDRIGTIKLSVVDHLDWSDEQGHLSTLQEKLNTYCHYVESGQLYDDYSEARNRRPLISLVFFNPPTDEALRVLAVFQQAIEAEGIGFEWKLEKAAA